MSERAALRVAVAQPRIEPGRDPREKVDRARELVDEAAARGAEVVVFPEGYPGPLRVGEAYDAAAAMGEAAGRNGCAVYWSRIELAGHRSYETVGYLVGEDGIERARYPRSHPATGDVHPVLNGAPMVPGPGLVTADVRGVTVGLLVCSELWLPEVSRVLVLRGADVLLAPAGGGFGAVARNWQLMARARAVENQCYVALTQNLIGAEIGTALLAGPEHDVASSAEEPLVVATLDLARARWLRSRDDSMEAPKPFSALPGLVRARRPELYGELAEPRSDGYDYWAVATGSSTTGNGREGGHEGLDEYHETTDVAATRY